MSRVKFCSRSHCVRRANVSLQLDSQVNLSFCPITDVGLLAIARLSCMQNMKLLHLSKVTAHGIREAVFNSGYLKKVKLLTALRSQIPEDVMQMSEARGCRPRWMEKAFLN